ncbi:MAG: hypothetical protein WKG01_12845 [Kofleriaceae bacterium]
MTILRPAILVFLLLFTASCSKKSMPASTYKDTAASFDQFAQELITAVKDDNKSEFAAIVSKLDLTDPKGWFDKTFGPEAGPRLFAEYEANPMKDWKRGYPELRKLVVDQGRDTITTSRHDSASDEMATGHQSNALRAMKQPVALYRIQLTRPDGEKSFTLWSFVHQDNQFRFIGKTKQVTAGEVDKTVDMLGELPMKRARELMKETGGAK